MCAVVSPDKQDRLFVFGRWLGEPGKELARVAFQHERLQDFRSDNQHTNRYASCIARCLLATQATSTSHANLCSVVSVLSAFWAALWLETSPLIQKVKDVRENTDTTDSTLAFDVSLAWTTRKHQACR